MPECYYRCGKEAIHQFKNGRWCCSTNPAQCPSNKITGDDHHFYNRKHTDKSREQMRRLKKGCIPWNKGKIDVYSEDTLKKMSEVSKRENLSKETLRKMRLVSMERVKKNAINGYQIHPNFNPSVCALMDEYGKQYGYNFKHAMNGGEHYFKDLGFWVDGYDVERNTVFEGDEKHHFDADGNLCKKDIERQKEIVDTYGCTFIRMRI